MKKIFGLVLSLGLFFAGNVSAQMMGNYWTNDVSGEGQTRASADINAALQSIYQTQNIGSQSQILCGKVTDDQFEKLGDAVMGYGISEQQHAAMENMMGGEGSATLRQAHVNMGRSYLGCWSNYNGGPAYMPMMGYFYGSSTPAFGYYPYGMMGGFGRGWNMAGGWYGGFGWPGIIVAVLLWVLLALGIAAIAKWLRKK